MDSKFCGYFTKFWRTKPTSSVTSESNLIRCLGLFNLIVIGIGGMIGSGIYVMSGFAIRDQAGPSAALSFFLAALAVLLIAACYMELASKLHKTGSTYLYIYLTIGEFPAFVSGLCIMIMVCLGGAVNARSWSYYLDSLCNGAISNFTMEHIAEWNIGPPIARYPDFLAVVILLFLMSVVILGANFSAKFSVVFVFINISVLGLVTICGFIFGDLKNWTNDGVDSFFPYGWSGTIQATAVCFWAFSGFEMISCAVEETRNPERNIPLATGIVMLIVTCLYISTTAALSLMVPYSSLSSTTPLAMVFVDIGQSWGRYVVSVGTLCAFTTSIISTFYTFARMGLAIAEDGLLFCWFSRVNKRTKVPVLSTIFCGSVEVVIACFLDVQNLISFSVNLILLCYCAVCAGVIIISYRPQSHADTGYQPVTAVDEEHTASNTAVDASVKPARAGYTRLETQESYAMVTVIDGISESDDTVSPVEESTSFHDDAHITPPIQVLDQRECNQSHSATVKVQNTEDFTGTIDPDKLSKDSDRTEELNVDRSQTGYLHATFASLKPFMVLKNGRCALFALGMMSLFMLGLSFCITYAVQPLERVLWWPVLLFILAAFGIVIFFGIICIHRQTSKQVVLKQHCIPLVPAIGIVMCLILLVANSTRSSWIGCGVLLTFATLIYVSYSMRHSNLNQKTGVPKRNNHLLTETENAD